MVLIHLLGLLDLFAAITILGGHFGLLHVTLLYTAIYLITKLFFFHDWMSIIDMLAAIYAIYLFFSGHGTGITWFFMLWFLYKLATWLFFTLTN